MKNTVPASLSWAYVIVVLAAVMEFGLLHPGWALLAIGGVVLGVAVAVKLILLAAGVYRAWMVATISGVLESCPVSGFALALRRVGIGGLYAGAAIGVFNMVIGPLAVLVLPQLAFVAAVTFPLGQVGLLALVLFELSRLVGFEHNRARLEVADTVIQR